MSDEQLVDLLPIKKYRSILRDQDGEIIDGDDVLNDLEYVFRVDDVEQLLKKLANPKNLTKVMGSLMTGQKLNLEDFLT